MKHLFFAAGCLLASSAALAQAGHSMTIKAVEPMDRIPAWEKFLKENLGQSGAAVMIDLQDHKPIPLFAPMASHRRLEKFADIQFSSLTEVDGVYLVKRKPSTVSEDAWRKGQVMNWLAGISNEDLADLMEGQFTSDRLPRQVRDAIMPMVALTDDMWPSFGGAPFDMEASFAFGVNYTNREGQPMRYSLSNSLVGRLRDGKLPPRAATAGKHEAEEGGQELVRSRETALDFGGGRLLTVGDLLWLVRKEHGLVLTADRRLTHSWVFLAGGFSKESFSRAFRSLSEAPAGGPPEQVAGEATLAGQLLETALSRLKDHTIGLPAELSVEDIMAGRKMSGADLMRLFPDLKGDIASRGIDPGSQVSFRPGFQIYVQPRRSISSGSITMPDGREVKFGHQANVVLNFG